MQRRKMHHKDINQRLSFHRIVLWYTSHFFLILIWPCQNSFCGSSLYCSMMVSLESACKVLKFSLNSTSIDTQLWYFCTSKKEWYLTSQTHKLRDSCELSLIKRSFLLYSNESTLIATSDKESVEIKSLYSKDHDNHFWVWMLFSLQMCVKMLFQVSCFAPNCRFYQWPFRWALNFRLIAFYSKFLLTFTFIILV